jgi:chaperonin cofactor prefoldin
MLGVDSTLTTRTDSLQQGIERNEADQERLEQRVEQVEKRLRAQYTARHPRSAASPASAATSRSRWRC